LTGFAAVIYQIQRDLNQGTTLQVTATAAVLDQCQLVKTIPPSNGMAINKQMVIQLAHIKDACSELAQLKMRPGESNEEGDEKKRRKRDQSDDAECDDEFGDDEFDDLDDDDSLLTPQEFSVVPSCTNLCVISFNLIKQLSMFILKTKTDDCAKRHIDWLETQLGLASELSQIVDTLVSNMSSPHDKLLLKQQSSLLVKKVHDIVSAWNGYEDADTILERALVAECKAKATGKTMSGIGLSADMDMAADRQSETETDRWKRVMQSKLHSAESVFLHY